MNSTSYYFFYLEIALKDSNDSNIYAFENVSHIPTKKLAEIFEVNLDTDPNFQSGYILTEEIFARHEKYILELIGPINLKVFEYCLRLYTSNDGGEIRKLYKESIFE